LTQASAKGDTHDLINLVPDKRLRQRIKQVMGLEPTLLGSPHFTQTETQDWIQHVLMQVSEFGKLPEVLRAIRNGETSNVIFAIYGRRSRQLSEMFCRSETWVLPAKIEAEFLKRVREIAAKALGTTIALCQEAAKSNAGDGSEKFKDFNLIALGFFLVFRNPFLLDKLGKIIPNERCRKAVNLDAFHEYPFNAAETRREFVYGVILQRFLSHIDPPPTL